QRLAVGEGVLGFRIALAARRGGAIDGAAEIDFCGAGWAKRLAHLGRAGAAARGHRKVFPVAAAHAERWPGAGRRDRARSRRGLRRIPNSLRTALLHANATPRSEAARASPGIHHKTGMVNERLRLRAVRALLVMAWLGPAIHVFAAARKQDVDARAKPGHDGV